MAQELNYELNYLDVLDRLHYDLEHGTRGALFLAIFTAVSNKCLKEVMTAAGDRGFDLSTDFALIVASTDLSLNNEWMDRVNQARTWYEQGLVQLAHRLMQLPPRGCRSSKRS